MLKVVTLSVFCAFLVACASTELVENADEEPILYIDLTRDDQKDLLKDYWIVKRRQDPRYPMYAAKAGLSGCVYLTFGIMKNGRLGGVSITKSYPEGIFDASAVQALKNQRWSASNENLDKSPVLTSIRLDFSVSETTNRVEAEKQCALISFPEKF